MPLKINKSRKLGGPILTFRSIVVAILVFISTLLASHFLVRGLCNSLADPDSGYCPQYWPISEFEPRLPSAQHLIVAITLYIFVYIVAKKYELSGLSIFQLILIGNLLIIGSNLIQGWSIGFHIPVARGGADGFQYYHDAIKIDNPIGFISQFEELQPTLFTHSRTHPPGAVLLFYTLNLALQSPALMSLSILILSTTMSVFFFYKILDSEFRAKRITTFITLLFLALPAIQIYFGASIDAVITAGILGTLYFLTHENSYNSILGAILCLFLTSALTFGFLFVLPGFVVFEYFQRKSLMRTSLIMIAIGIGYFVIRELLGFNYVNSFRIASAYVGFWRPSDLLPYLLTRFEDIFELIVFLGPFLSLLFLRSARDLKFSTDYPLLISSYIVIGTITSMFLIGLFNTGETARIALFIFPFYLFPIAHFWNRHQYNFQDERSLLLLVNGQSFLMQLMGIYFW